MHQQIEHLYYVVEVFIYTTLSSFWQESLQYFPYLLVLFWKGDISNRELWWCDG